MRTFDDKHPSFIDDPFRLSSKKDFTVIECVIGFAVVSLAPNGVLISTSHCTGSNTVIIERLTKEMVKTSDGAVNLLETMPFTFVFQKTLTSMFISSYTTPENNISFNRSSLSFSL
jgi:hypothetical protein